MARRTRPKSEENSAPARATRRQRLSVEDVGGAGGNSFLSLHYVAVHAGKFEALLLRRAVTPRPLPPASVGCGMEENQHALKHHKTPGRGAVRSFNGSEAVRVVKFEAAGDVGTYSR